MRHAMLPAIAVATVAAGCLAACATPVTPPPAANQCVAGMADWAVGKPVSDELVAKIVSDTHSRTARVVRPGQAVTMDYRGDRVNVMLDEHDRVREVTCG
ncbi:MAG: I78 family peptidase inhibitor [Luteimonas sp.]